jgi:hypothetical protein
MSGSSPCILLPQHPPQRIALVSSHLGRWPHRRRDWFAALSTVCGELLTGGSTLLCVSGTTSAPYLQRCAELFGHTVESKEVQGVARSDRDRLAVCDADTVIVLATRSRSRTESLIDELLDRPAGQRPELCFAGIETLVPAPIASRWESLGAHRFVPHVDALLAPQPGPSAVRLATVREVDSADWLVHCTRECSGPWPGQSSEDYLDDLILGRASADHSVGSTLRRILVERRLRAVSRPVRGAAPAVSFSTCPLQELASRRIFRAHRGRWDFEPFGLAISRDWLIARGARPVVYRSRAELVGDDPFEQPARSRGAGGLDWTAEHEWRHPGDVDLSQLPPECGLVLVGSDSDVAAVAGQGCWGVLVVGRFRQDETEVQ